jgi:hypothetical protein
MPVVDRWDTNFVHTAAGKKKGPIGARSGVVGYEEKRY